MKQARSKAKTTGGGGGGQENLLKKTTPPPPPNTCHSKNRAVREFKMQQEHATKKQ